MSSIKIIISKSVGRFQTLWELKIFKYAIILHVFYVILSFIITLGFFPNKNDFLVYFKVGEVFLNNPNDLYNPANYDWPFRYLPISALLFAPFSLMGFEIGFIIFNLFNIIVNILICIVLYRIIIIIKGKDHEQDDKRVIFYICLYLMGLPQVFNYILGQINLYVTFLILLSLLYLLKSNGNKHQFLAGIFLGLSIIIKPTTLFIIPFLLIISFSQKEKKLRFEFNKSIIRFIGIILPVSANIIMFFIYPGLLEGFINANLTGSDTIILNHSFSITKLISNFLIIIGFTEINALIIFLCVLVVTGGLGFIIYVLRRVPNNSIIYGYSFGMVIMLLAYFDSWGHHLLNLTPLLIIIIFNIPRNSQITRKYIKPSFFFFNFFDLVFMGLYWLINPDIFNPIFPFNFIATIFLVLAFIGISRICLLKSE